MSTRIASKLESLSNVAVIVACIAFVLVLVRREWPTPQPGSAQSLRGATIQLATLTSAPSKHNLILFISETCPFCKKEMPFYRTLREKLPSATSLIAVFPRDQSAPEKFLLANSVKVDHVVSSNSLAVIGVNATPTLLLVDERGKVERAWVGAQPDAVHKDILASVARYL